MNPRSGQYSSDNGDNQETKDLGLDLPEKILIVDDSLTMRTMLARALEKEFVLSQASDGKEAWKQLIADRGIELVITDLDMPNLDGYGLLKAIRSSTNKRIRNTAVIVVTGVEDTYAKERAFKEGANDFVFKDSDSVELLARVRAHHKLAATIRELEASRKILTDQAYTDPLTRLTNRRRFFEDAEQCLSLMKRHNEDFSVIMLDIDHFKRINDIHGHQAGDEVLIKTAETLSQVVRSGDILARIGGEEFALALPYTSELAAVVLAERIRRAIKSAEYTIDGNKIAVTISQGVLALEHGGGENLDQLMARADKRLYLAKQRGRDRVCSTDVPEEENGKQAAGLCPKLQEALSMLEHGHSQALSEHLPSLLESIMPLFEEANRHADSCFDVEAIKSGISLLRKSAAG
jgi:diguanylate cyclase (GGDEF)-like protein